MLIKVGRRIHMTHLVETPANIDGRLLNNGVDDLRQGCQEVGGINFGVEKNFGSKEALKANIDRVFL